MKIRIIPKELVIAVVFMLNICLMVYIHNDLYKIALIGFMALFILSLVYKHNKILFPSFLWSFLLFVIWSWMSSSWEKGIYDSGLLVVLIIIFAFEVVIYNVLHYDRKYTYYLIDAMIVASIALSLYIINYYGINMILIERFDNELINSNRAGNIFSTSALFALFMKYKKDKKEYYFIFILLTAMTFISGSKGAVIDLFVGITIFFVLKDKTKSIITIRNIAMAVIIVFAGYFILINVPTFYDIIGRRLMEFVDILLGKSAISVGRNSTYIRITLIKFGIEKFKKSPIIGYGLDSFRWLGGLYNTYAHSNIIELLVDLGIVGVLLYYLQYIKIFNKLIQNRKRIEDIDSAFIIAYFIRLIIQNVISIYYNEIFCYIVFIIMVVLMESSFKESTLIKANIND